MGAVALRLRRTAEGKSEEFNKWAHDIRAAVYGGCTAAILLGPAVIACEATAAIILEKKIADYKRETESFVKEFTEWAGTFEEMKKMADGASKVSAHWY